MNLILDESAAKQQVRELLGFDVENVELMFLCKPGGKTPQECAIVGSYDRFCQPVWKFKQGTEVKYLNVIGADINQDKHFFLQEHELHSGYMFKKGEVQVSATKGWKNGKFGVFLIEGEVRNGISHLYRS